MQILRRPVWLTGLGMQVAGWVFQAFALKNGALMVVQSVTTLSLVIALPLGAKITSQQISVKVITALQATKVFMTQLGHGVAALLGDWTTYALVVSAIAGFVLQQSALRTDVLAPAMASSNAVTFFASVIFGLNVFGESLSHGHGRLVPAIIGLAFALVGIVLLAGPSRPVPPSQSRGSAIPRSARSLLLAADITGPGQARHARQGRRG